MKKAATKTEFPAVTYACHISEVKPLSSDTFQVELNAPLGTVLKYHSGQYLQIELDVNGDGQLHSLSYSITNSFDPAQPRCLQLFIQNVSNFSDRILKRLSEFAENNTVLNVKLPMGLAFLQTDLTSPHLLIAAGSGISKIKCIAEDILRNKPDAEVSIYWSNKGAEDFYLLELFQSWVDQNQHLSFTPILESPAKNWQGQSGYIYEVVGKDFEQLDQIKAYLCGSPQMVYGTIDQLKSRGLKEVNCYSDVFEYAPREQKLAV